MNIIRKFILRLATHLATSNEVPDRYSPGSGGHNFTYLWIKYSDDEAFLPTTKSDPKGLVGVIMPPAQHRWEDNRTTEACLPFSQFGNPHFDITRMYDCSRFEHSHLLGYIVSEFIQRHRFLNALNISLENAAQNKFAANFEFSSERMNILKEIAEWKREKSKRTSRNTLEERFTAVTVCDQVFSRRFWGLPDHDYYLYQVEFALDSLVSSGELVKTAAQYQLTPKAFSSLSDFEEEKQNVLKADKHDRMIRNLTIAIAIATAVQAIGACLSLFL